MKRFSLLAAVAAVGLVLAGCGGGGSSSGPSAAQQAAMEAAKMQSEAIVKALEAAEMAKNAIDTENPTAAQVTALNNAIGAVETAIEAAEDVEDTSKYESDVEGYKEYAGLAATAVRLGTSLASAENEADQEIRTARTDAGTAATNAMKSSEDAGKSVETAMAAVKYLATLQTGQMAARYAGEAKDAADKAKAAYDTAKTEAGKANAATNITAAVEARSNAQKAAMDAKKYADMADMKSKGAVREAAGELKINGTVKSVGSSSVDATAPNSKVTTDGSTVETGLLSMLTTNAPGGASVTGVSKTADTDYVAPMAQGNDNSALAIGKRLDSADDMARLELVTARAGTKTVKVFSKGSSDLAATSTKEGYISIDLTTTPDPETNNVRLRSEGMFYPGGTADAALDEEAAAVAHDAKAVEVFSYRNPNTSDGPKIYVVLQQESTVSATGVTTYTYRSADIHVEDLDMDGDGNTDMVGVMAKIPDAVDYEYLHFGTWASLGDAEKDGTQMLDSLGIGFVQAIGDGLTAASDMPNISTATYNGNWVANVQDADEDGDGNITRDQGKLVMTADFDKSTVVVDLMDLAKVSGAKIVENGFSGGTLGPSGGTLVTADNAEMFDGTTSGNFFGDRGKEAGGVFDYKSKDYKLGAFRGAFGGAR